MITRRSFLSVLAGLPFVGKLIPQKIETAEQARAAIQAATGLPVTQPEIHPKLWFHKDAFALVSEPFYGEVCRVNVLYGWGNAKPQFGCLPRETDRPRLTFAEWDQRYQA